jgi:hypothetical protein
MIDPELQKILIVMLDVQDKTRKSIEELTYALKHEPRSPKRHIGVDMLLGRIKTKGVINVDDISGDQDSNTTGK